MTPERWTRVEELYHEALTKAPADRAAFLARECAGDAALGREVESLLARDGSAEAFLERPHALAGVGPSSMTGRRLGVFEVQAQIGAGGMGEVYRARDTKLGRDVAIKILPRAFTSDPERLSRFEREARMLASLNHPHIGAIYGLEDAGGVRALVLELVDGETVADRIGRGPLAIPDALGIARQIAEALEAAHEKGVIHRDLKPANIKITSDGHVKVLDFGLAKASGGDTSALDYSQAPTMTVGGTREGVVLGTPAYMSPEQARGRTVDKRTDVWAFGCVFYEMLTGRAPFRGHTVSDTIAAVLEHQPDLSALPGSTPAEIRRLLQRCFEKDSKRRLRDIGEARVAIETTADPTADSQGTSDGETRPAARRGRRTLLVWVGSIAATALVVAAATMRVNWTDAAPLPRLELQINPPDTTAFFYQPESIRFAVSPDGQRLAFIATGPGSTRRVWLRALASLKAEPVAGTDGAVVVFWSPDARSIAFVVGDALKRLELASGTAVTICKVPKGVGFYGTWSPNGEILFASPDRNALYRVATAGGDAAVFVKPDPSRDESRVMLPSLLPDGRRYLYLARRLNGSTFLMLGESGKAPKALMPIESNAQYVEPGLLVFAKGGALVAQSFDASTGQLAGEPFAIAESVQSFLSTTTAEFSVSPGGTIVFQSHTDRARLAWLDRSGHEVGTVGSPGGYYEVRIDAAGRSALASRRLPTTGTLDIWSLDFDRGTETRLTLDDAFTEMEGVLVPDGNTMIFAATRGQAPRLIRRDLRTGHDEPLVPQGVLMQDTEDVSRDGRLLAFQERTESGTYNLWTVPLTGTATPTQLRPSPFNQGGFRFAPDGDHYTFLTNESGRQELYLSRLSGNNKTLVSTGGAFEGRWTQDGREIVYVSPDLKMMAVPVRTSPTVELGAPVALFAMANRKWMSFDVSPDGKRFLVVVPEVIANEQPLTALLNVVPRLAEARAR